MNQDEMKTKVLAALRQVAPEADPDAIDPETDLREQLDIDSMDLLNFAIGLYKQFGVEIPEADYPKLITLNGCINYLNDALSRK